MPDTRSIARAALSLLLGAAIVAGGLLLGGIRQDLEAVGDGDPMRNYFTHEMPRLPGAAESPLGKNLSFNGMQMEISHLQTGRTVAEVRDFYRDAFTRMQLKTSVTEGDGGATVYANDERAKVQRIVSIQRRDDQTFVFPAVVPLYGVPALSPPRAADVAVMDGALAFTDIRATDYGRPSRLVTWYHPAPVEDVAKAVKERMAALGWTEQEGGFSLAGTALQFTRDRREATYTLFRKPGGALTAVLATIHGE
jgi:hypothetical protein